MQGPAALFLYKRLLAKRSLRGCVTQGANHDPAHLPVWLGQHPVSGAVHFDHCVERNGNRVQQPVTRFANHPFSAFFSAKEEIALQLMERGQMLQRETKEVLTPELERWENEGGRPRRGRGIDEHRVSYASAQRDLGQTIGVIAAKASALLDSFTVERRSP